MDDPLRPTKPNWIRWAKLLIQLTVLSLVIWGIRNAALAAAGDFEKAGLQAIQLRPTWLLLAGLSYTVAMVPPCVFWKRTMESMGQQPQWGESVAAFFVGHLGKYVPGKALVVILRTAWIKSARVDATVAATSVFVETLTAMAVGAVVAAVILAISFRGDGRLLALAICLAFCAGVPTWPPLFRQCVRWLQLRRANPLIEQAVAGLNWRLMASGWLTMSLGWILYGVSLWATVNAIPNVTSPITELPLLTACVALATVAGFLSLVPAGAFVRELVVISLLRDLHGEAVAIVSAAALRLVWMGVDILLAAIFYTWHRRRH